MHDSKHSDDAPPRRRRFPRIWGRLQGRLVLTGMDVKPAMLVGVTRDLSLNGVFLNTFQTVSTSLMGCEGVLELGALGNRKSFPVQIRYVNFKGVGLIFRIAPQELGEAFGILLAADGQERLGADVMPRENVSARLVWEGHAPVSVRLENINSGQFECAMPPESDPPEVGSSLHLEISFQGDWIRGEAVVRKVERKGGAHDSSLEAHNHVSALFSIMSEADRKLIQSMIAHLHRRRLDAILRQHATTAALFSEGDEGQSRIRDRDAIQRQLQTFLGFRDPRGRS
ncbi:MAG: hypothetical protein HQL76_00135 [Magnetococcales bacterium]|nr:hypothetical protein [Magnetococcales bacterium]